MLEFVGPLPPPLHGFAWVNQQMLEGLKHRDSVRIRDRAWPRARQNGCRKLLGLLGGAVQGLSFVTGLFLARPHALYLGCSGGAGMLVDAPFVLGARLFGVPVYVHHHAFSYLNAPNRIARFCLGRMRGCQHIVLSRYMGQLLSRVHGIPSENIAVLSNVAFLPALEAEPVTNRDRLVVGFLSNITVEKGILDFFDLAHRFAGRIDSPEFVVAGPVAPAIRALFGARLQASPNVRHLGALYGEAKDEFFRSLDVLAFPSRNEAEPVTILEALRVGVPVIANHRGCIPTMIDETSGQIVVHTDNFADEAVTWIDHLIASPADLEQFKQGASTRFTALRTEHSANLAKILDAIAAGKPLRGCS